MKTLAIHPKLWKEFCDSFSQLNKGITLSIELIHFDNRRDTAAKNEIFQRMTFDTSDACSNMISIILGADGQRRVNYIVVEPIHIRLKEEKNGHRFVQIEAENGVTLLDCQSGKIPALNFESEFSDVENSSATIPS